MSAFKSNHFVGYDVHDEKRCGAVTLKDSFMNRNNALPSLGSHNSRVSRHITNSLEDYNEYEQVSDQEEPQHYVRRKQQRLAYDKQLLRMGLYEQSQHNRHVVNETNVNGRQSVKNLLALFSPEPLQNASLSSSLNTVISARGTSKPLPKQLLPNLDSQRQLEGAPPQRRNQTIDNSSKLLKSEMSTGDLVKGRASQSPKPGRAKKVASRGENHVVFRSQKRPLHKVVIKQYPQLKTSRGRISRENLSKANQSSDDGSN